MTQWKLLFYPDPTNPYPTISYFNDYNEALEEYQQRLSWSYGDRTPKPKLTEVNT